ncbi:hypothetical protein BSKO_05297 [Bryopsis sp. KO-2023]|nr:hypothetical protein BSKO_05297 [Bryopsis sp. KO-2023]
MGKPIFVDMVEAPATTAIVALCVSVWGFITHRRLGYEDVGMSYERVVTNGEYWRLIVSQISHVEILHLVFNISALWSLGFVERTEGMGSVYYLRVTLVLLLFSEVVCLGLYHFAVKVLKREHYTRVTAVGYSCVVFGWMSNLSVAPQSAAKFSLLGLGNLPMWATPFCSLILTSVLIPKASFLGHLSGILVGYTVGLGLFDWLNTFWAVSLCVWAAMGILLSLARSGTLNLPFIRFHGANDIETGDSVRIQEGTIVR